MGKPRKKSTAKTDGTTPKMSERLPPHANYSHAWRNYGTQNVLVAETDEWILIAIDRKTEPTQSASGKSLVIGTTRGNKYLPASGLSLGVNCYRKADL